MLLLNCFRTSHSFTIVPIRLQHQINALLMFCNPARWARRLLHGCYIYTLAFSAIQLFLPNSKLLIFRPVPRPPPLSLYRLPLPLHPIILFLDGNTIEREMDPFSNHTRDRRTMTSTMRVFPY